MATSTFTRKIVLSDKAVDILAANVADEKAVEVPEVEISLNDKEFLNKCLEFWDCKK